MLPRGQEDQTKRIARGDGTGEKWAFREADADTESDKENDRTPPRKYSGQ